MFINKLNFISTFTKYSRLTRIHIFNACMMRYIKIDSQIFRRYEYNINNTKGQQYFNVFLLDISSNMFRTIIMTIFREE
jgi:hypothetical protein